MYEIFDDSNNSSWVRMIYSRVFFIISYSFWHFFLWRLVLYSFEFGNDEQMVFFFHRKNIITTLRSLNDIFLRWTYEFMRTWISFLILGYCGERIVWHMFNIGSGHYTKEKNDVLKLIDDTIFSFFSKTFIDTVNVTEVDLNINLFTFDILYHLNRASILNVADDILFWFSTFSDQLSAVEMFFWAPKVILHQNI